MAVPPLQAMDWIVQTRLQPPSLRQDFVPRRQLLEILFQAVTSRRLTLISAPAGYGKTTLLAALPHLFPELSVAWLSLDVEDNDPAGFLSALIAALQRLNPACGVTAQTVLANLTNPAAEVRRVMGVLINDILETLPAPCLLVLDDLHVVTEPVVHAASDYLLDRMPPHMHLAVGTRYDPPLALARLRARDELAEFHLAELRFTLDEATALLNEQLRLGLSAADVTALYARTEGWIAGLRLLATSLQRVPPFTERTAFITEVVQSSRHVFDLLAEEVLDHQEPALRTFLLETSILSELTPVACQAVTGRQNAETILEELYHRNLFLVAIAYETGPATGETMVRPSSSLTLPPASYRYHDLFADFLRRQLARELPDRLPELHRRAAEAQTSPTRIINHYLAANLWSEAAQTVERVGEQLLQQGWLASLQRWILALPAEIREAHSRLAYLLGVGALHQRDLVEAGFHLERALHAFEIADNQLDQGKTLAYLSSLAFYQADFSRGLALIEQALACPIPPDTRVRLLVERARIAHFQGEFTRGQVDLDRAWHICQESGDLAAVYALLEGYIPSFAAIPAGLDRLEQLCQVAATKAIEGEGLLEVVLCEQQAMVHCYRGDLTRTLQAAERALALGERLGGRPVWQYWTVRIFILTAHTSCGHQPQAEGIMEQLLLQRDSLDVLAKSGFLYFVAHACWLHGRLPDAQQIYQQLRRMEIPPDSVVTHTILAMLQGILELAEGHYAAALRALQEAVSLETKSPLFNVFGSARVLLSYLYLKMDLSDEALTEIALALAECEAQGAPGRILIEGAPAIPVLKLALEHNRHSAVAGQLLETLEAGRRTEPQPVTVPDTGETLSTREVEVLSLLAAGASNQEIAEALVLSIHTVKRHVANILVKLNVANRIQASTRARELGIVE